MFYCISKGCQFTVDLELPLFTSILVEGTRYASGFISCIADTSPTLMLNLYHIDSQGIRRLVQDGEDGGRVGVVVASARGTTILASTFTSAKVSDRGIYECEGQDNGITDRKNTTIYVDCRQNTKSR